LGLIPAEVKIKPSGE